MNTTMAPVVQLQQGSLEELRHHDLPYEVSVGRKRNGIKRGQFDSNRNRNGNGNNNNNNKNSDNNPNTNTRAKDRGFDFLNFGRSSSTAASILQTTTPPPPPPPPSTVPTTIVVTTTVSSPSLPDASSTLISSSVVPTTTSSPPSVEASTFLPDTSSQPRKGLTNEESSTTSAASTSSSTTQVPETTATISATPVLETALESSPPIPALPSKSGNHNNDQNGLSPLAERLLVAAGTIGSFIIIVAAIYFICRMKKRDIFSSLRKRKVRKGGARGWYGWRRASRYPRSDAPPRYPGGEGPYEYPTDEKSIPAQRSLDAFFSPTARPPLATPAGAAALSRADSERQELVREALLSNPAPFGPSSAAPLFVPPKTTETFYKADSQEAPISGRLSNYNDTGTQNTLLSRQPSDSYKNTGTQNTFLSQQTSNLHDPNQREATHMSYLSSLSSGFGDGLIIPESEIVNHKSGGSDQSSRQSRNPAAGRFSWATSGPRTPGLRGDRNSVYTTASVESAPRYRTVNSWVAQQAGRVERRQQNEQEVPSMPAVPKLMQIGVDHRRKQSDNSAFQHHPGDEIELSRGSRIASSILDRKIGLK